MKHRSGVLRFIKQIKNSGANTVRPCLSIIKNKPPEIRRFKWSGLRDSNSPPPPWQGGALPDELNPQVAIEIIIKEYAFVNT